MSGRDGEGRAGEPSPGDGSGSVPPWDPRGGPTDDDPQRRPAWSPSSGGVPEQGPPAWGPASHPIPQQGGAGEPRPGSWQQPTRVAPPRAPVGGPRPSRPGIVPLRPLGVGEILDGAVAYIRAHPKVVLGASVIVAVITQLIAVPIDVALSGGRTSFGPGQTPDIAQLADLFASRTVSAAVGGLITLIGTTVLSGLLVVVLGRAVLGAPVDGSACWQAARERIIGLLGVTFGSLLIGVVIVALSLVPGALVLLASVGAGVAVMVLGGVGGLVALTWVSVLLSLAPPVYVLEGCSVLQALRRSVALVRGRWWPVFGVQVLAALIAAALGIVLGMLFGAAASVIGASEPLGLAAQSVAAIGSIIGLTVTAPFQAGVRGLLYIDARMRREGFDLELQRVSTPRSF